MIVGRIVTLEMIKCLKEINKKGLPQKRIGKQKGNGRYQWKDIDLSERIGVGKLYA